MSDISLLLQQALSASTQGNGQTALALFEQATEKDPQSGIPHFLMGAEYAAMGDVGRAEASYANAVLLAPDLIIARYQLGLLQFSLARAALALVTWQPLLNLPDSSPLPHFVRGFECLAHDQFEKARQNFENGLACPNDNAPLNSDIRMVLNQIDSIQSSGALELDHGNAATNAADAADSSHVLLSNYRQQGPSH